MFEEVQYNKENANYYSGALVKELQIVKNVLELVYFTFLI
jgi:hypothetical protein